jgi:beta-glucanase (GH16 family)
MYREDTRYEQAPPPKRRRRGLGKAKRAEVVLGTALAAGVIIAVGVMAWASSKGIPSESFTPSSSTSTNSPVAVTVAPPSDYKLKFNSAFSGSTLDTKVWATCYYWSLSGCTNGGNNGEEREWYLPSQAQVRGGVLNLVAQHQPTEGTAANGEPKTYTCRSGMVTTMPSLNFKYGYVQMVARLPYGNGLWPAFWLAASDKKWPPEVDVFEHWASQDNVGVYLHPSDGVRQGGRSAALGNLSKGWHTFTLLWTKTSLKWYVDGQQEFSTKTDIPQQDMYIVANVADTSTAANSCSGTMLIKSVKVWQPAA